MATKRVCDRCGAEINPVNFVTYAGMRRIKTGVNNEDYAIPAADVAPVLHGRWLCGEDYMFCSKCGMQWNYCDNDTQDFKFCPNCGAKMDGGEDDAAD